METELKYRLKNEIYESLAKGLKRIHMHAVYYDTADGRLGKRMIALRMRRQDERSVMTLKYGGGAKEGLHKREEINIETDRLEPERPEIREIIGEVSADELIPVIIMDFDRSVKNIRKGASVIEMALDKGSINGKIPICELELELIEGNEEDLLILGRELQDKFKLEFENRSKLERGLLNGSVKV